MPSEAPHVLDVSSVGPVNPASSPDPRKAFYSNYGVEQIGRRGPGRRQPRVLRHAAVQRAREPDPRRLPAHRGAGVREVDANGMPERHDAVRREQPGHVVPRSVPLVRNCANGVCALYQWIQGTSMASPHAVGVAALIVAEKGKRDRDQRRA
jgi:subtilisin family serine protease